VERITLKKSKREPKSNDDSTEPGVVLSGEEKFRIETFNVILDSLVVDLKRRISAYEEVDSRFHFLFSALPPHAYWRYYQ
jgi:hypothetical protein